MKNESNRIVDHMLAVSRQVSRSNRLDDGACLGRIFMEWRNWGDRSFSDEEHERAVMHLSFRRAAVREVTDENKLRRLPDEFRDHEFARLSSNSQRSHSCADEIQLALDIHEVIGQADPDVREIATSIMDGKTQSEIAEALGISPQAVHKKWKRAKLELSKRLIGYRDEY